MAAQQFKKTAFSPVYQKYMIPVSNEIMNLVLSYVKDKTNGRPLEMAVDVGCGTGRYTLPLAPHFKNVLGTDFSDSQINVAKQYSSAKNVSYMVAPAEKLPLRTASVDLVTAALAAHWFKLDEFSGEAVRVLKTKGCLALHGGYPATELEYKDLSHDLNVVMLEVWNTLFQYNAKKIEHMLCQYKTIYQAIPLQDKEWIKDIPVKTEMSISEIIGLIQSVVMFQTFKEKDMKKAEQFLIQTENRFREILGEEADSVRLTAYFKHYCVLACKH
ncbi:putative methyltransferase isoform 1-T1 [Leptodactylus fuscus]|uniref:putative methyltransferase DDB_G0268948 n=1 Tax=Leptodactylus fuscus TaxID=238119 RepID=UPI003F4EE74C